MALCAMEGETGEVVGKLVAASVASGGARGRLISDLGAMYRCAIDSYGMCRRRRRVADVADGRCTGTFHDVTVEAAAGLLMWTVGTPDLDQDRIGALASELGRFLVSRWGLRSTEDKQVALGGKFRTIGVPRRENPAGYKMVIEQGERSGHWHIHFLTLGLVDTTPQQSVWANAHKQLISFWREMTGHPNPTVRYDVIDSEKAVFYLAKYLAKGEEGYGRLTRSSVKLREMLNPWRPVKQEREGMYMLKKPPSLRREAGLDRDQCGRCLRAAADCVCREISRA